MAASILEEARPYVDTSIQVERKEHRRRWKITRDAMEREGYDMLYVCGSELDKTDAAWLVGMFDPMIERYGVVLPREGNPVV